ncbi:MAG TPA: MarR family transcriptional regulator [Acidimicrobiales bacterium]|nr:MarR family transcriptional regulator [Acidimicrobiales bacterium]
MMSPPPADPSSPQPPAGSAAPDAPAPSDLDPERLAAAALRGGEPERRARLTIEMVRAGRSLGIASSLLSHACAERLGLHDTDWECVSLLDESDGRALTAGQLAELTGLTSGAITGVIDRLEAKGFVARVRDPADRRRIIVELRGPKMGEVAPILAGMMRDMVALQADYGDDDLATLVEVLDRAGRVIRRHALAIRAEGRR